MKNLFFIILLCICHSSYTQDTSRVVETFHFKELVKLFSEEGKISALFLNQYKQLENEMNNSNYILDGYVSANYFMLDSYGYVWDPWLVRALDMSYADNFIIKMNMDLGLRMFYEESSPVRTSYKPGLKIYYKLPLVNRGDHVVQYVSGSFNHYSNGQNGETLSSNTQRMMGELPIDDLQQQVNEGHTFNRFNGSFSTNYWTAGYHYNRLIDSCIFFNANLEYQSILNDAAYEQDLEQFYSRKNVLFNCSILWTGREHGNDVEKLRLKFHAKLALGDNSLLHPDLSWEKDVNLSATVFVRLPASANIAGFVDLGYAGSDEHNIYLEDRILYFRIGVASGYFLYLDN